MTWRLYSRVARLSRTAFAQRLEWQFPYPRRQFQSLAVEPTIGPFPGPAVSTDPCIEPTTASHTLDIDDDMAQIKAEVVQLQQLLGLVPPTKNKPVKDVTFICIDCEAFEHNQKKITEIGSSLFKFFSSRALLTFLGIATLDSRAIKDVDPGENGESWFKLMNHLHLRPIEYKKLVNKKFIKGCPEDFDFGTSTFITLRHASEILNNIFRDPSRIHEACDPDVEIADTDTEIILVGHDLRNDTEYMKRLRFTPQHVVGSLDTQVLARPSKKQGPGLKALLAALSIDAKHLHNAGNDAAYTLQALVALAVQQHRRPGDLTKTLVAARAQRDAERLAQKEKQMAAAEAARHAKELAGPEIHDKGHQTSLERPPVVAEEKKRPEAKALAHPAEEPAGPKTHDQEHQARLKRLKASQQTPSM